MSALPDDATVGEDEDGDAFAFTPRVHIEAAHACFRRLGWRCVLRGEGRDPTRAALTLTARGYARVERGAGLLELRHPEGHTVVIVPATGRVQLRLDVDTPLSARVATALALAEELTAAAS